MNATKNCRNSIEYKQGRNSKLIYCQSQDFDLFFIVLNFP
jgi:hypothetical protein